MLYLRSDRSALAHHETGQQDDDQAIRSDEFHGLPRRVLATTVARILASACLRICDDMDSTSKEAVDLFPHTNFETWHPRVGCSFIAHFLFGGRR
jgi:hypothetical protein